MIEFDENKNRINIEKHGIALTAAIDFEFDGALIEVDDRKNYGEVRYLALGYIGNRLYRLVFTLRAGNVRAISLRKTNSREERYYAKT